MEEGNDLSPFTVDVDTPGDLIKIIQDFFCPPNRYLVYKPINYDATNQVDNGGNEEDFDDTLTGEIIPGFVE